MQLFDQDGQPVTVKPQTECVYGADEVPLDQTLVYYPWTTAARTGYQRLPGAEPRPGPDVPQPDPAAFTGEDRPRVGAFPLPSVAGRRPAAVSRCSNGDHPGRCAFAAGPRPGNHADQPDRQRLLKMPGMPGPSR